MTQGHGGTVIRKWSSSKGPSSIALLEDPGTETPLHPRSCSDQDYGVPHGYDFSRPTHPTSDHSLQQPIYQGAYPICFCICFHCSIATYKKSCHPHPASGPTHLSIADASASVAFSSSSQQRSNLQRPNHARCQPTMQRIWVWFGPLNLRFPIRARFAASSSKKQEESQAR